MCNTMPTPHPRRRCVWFAAWSSCHANFSEFIPEQSDHTCNSIFFCALLGRWPLLTNVWTMWSAHGSPGGPSPSSGMRAHSGSSTSFIRGKPWRSEASYLAGTAAEEYSPASLSCAAAGRLRTKRVTGATVQVSCALCLAAGRLPLRVEKAMAAHKGALPHASVGLRKQAERAQSYERKWLRPTTSSWHPFRESLK